jgi:hypothetical protein
MTPPVDNQPTPVANPRQLKPNPFTTYRDPETGKWMVVKPNS